MSHFLIICVIVFELQQKSYGAGDKEVCEFNTVEDFWKYWSFIPKPRCVVWCSVGWQCYPLCVAVVATM